MSALTLAIPSKGRLKEQTDEYFSDCGLRLKQSGGDRGYVASMDGAPDVRVLLLSAGEIAKGLLAGEFHLGVTGEDLLQEHAENLSVQASLLKPLGFGFARMVVAVPKSWIDVNTIADLEEIGAIFQHRHKRRMRVATKYLRSTRDFFAARGLTQYRVVESAGATEAAPASGSAELIVDITTTGATLAANGLKIVSDGEIMMSQAQLTASLGAAWTPQARATLRAMLDLIEARQTAKASRRLSASSPLLADHLPDGVQAVLVGGDAIVSASELHMAATHLVSNGLGPIATSSPDFVFQETNAVYDRFAKSLNGEKPA